MYNDAALHADCSVFRHTFLQRRDELQRMDKSIGALEVCDFLAPGSEFLRQSFAELIFCWVCDVLDSVTKREDVLSHRSKELDIRVVVCSIVTRRVVLNGSQLVSCRRLLGRLTYHMNNIEIGMRVPGACVIFSRIIAKTYDEAANMSAYDPDTHEGRRTLTWQVACLPSDF